MAEIPEDVRRNFEAVHDALLRGGVPLASASAPDPELLTIIAQRLEQIELASRPSGTLWARSGTTSGTGGTYADADTYRVPFIGKSLTLVLPDAYGMVVQTASREHPEWQLDTLNLQGPIAYTFPLTTESIRLRALSDTSASTQAKYSLLVTQSAQPIGVVFGDLDTPTELAADATLTATLAVLTSLLATARASKDVLEESVILSKRMLLAMELLIDTEVSSGDAISAGAL